MESMTEIHNKNGEYFKYSNMCCRRFHVNTCSC